MSEPACEMVLAAATAKLAAMPVTWGGTYPQTPIVTREHLALEEISPGGLPMLQVIEGRTAWSFDTTKGSSKIVIRHVLEFGVIGFIHGSDAVATSTWLQRLRDDATLALIAQENLGIDFAGVNNREILSLEFGEVEWFTRLIPTTAAGGVGAFAQPVKVHISEEVTAT